ncbi:unnamed protein product [Effrenium voratum]|nr:unnamed protein product [Effrenium voratum]
MALMAGMSCLGLPSSGHMATLAAPHPAPGGHPVQRSLAFQAQVPALVLATCGAWQRARHTRSRRRCSLRAWQLAEAQGSAEAPIEEVCFLDPQALAEDWESFQNFAESALGDAPGRLISDGAGPVVLLRRVPTSAEFSLMQEGRN